MTAVYLPGFSFLEAETRPWNFTALAPARSSNLSTPRVTVRAHLCLLRLAFVDPTHLPCTRRPGTRCVKAMRTFAGPPRSNLKVVPTGGRFLLKVARLGLRGSRHVLCACVALETPSTLVVVLAELLAGFVSPAPLAFCAAASSVALSIVAVSVLPPTLVILTTRVTVALAPLASVPRLQLTVGAATHDPPLAAADTAVAPTGRASLTTTFGAASGPLLVAVR